MISMTINSKSEIPLELYLLIIEYIDDQGTLFSLLMSSRVGVIDIQRKLYRSVEFHYQNDDQHMIFLRSILNSNMPPLSDSVRRYCYTANSNTSPKLLDYIKQALVTFTNLQHLRFAIPDEDTFISVLPPGNPPFNLELFQWSCKRGAGRDIRVLRFLSTQRTLKALILYNTGPDIARMKLRDLLDLTDFVGSPAHLPFLPHNVPIKRMHWTSKIRQEPGRFPPLTSLRVLSFSPNSPRPQISTIADRFGSVEILGLNCIHRNELADLFRLQIHTLVLDKIGDDPLNFRFTKEVFRNTVFLQQIFILLSANNKYDTSCYFRWDRGVETPTAVDGDTLEVNWWRQLDL
ncbi:hypothetical protein BDZ94DRAFT_887921 [Collybia nuda]|uniref:Uncharacterized protein n=1 Tax=Collybia nuda TaxID=64659 RepID=A0A9P5XZS9_9AGAR|nr:hypothetical protein BDZ94DRAFT_887921 [Collybia nuda]